MTRIVATSDTHFPFGKLPDGDILIHAGDLMMTGGPGEWYPRLESLSAQPHKHKIYVPGNHDYYVSDYEGIARAELRRAGITLAGTTGSNMLVEVAGLKILGLPWVTNLDGWAYNVSELWLRDYMEFVATPAKADIIISHSPVYGIRDAILPEIPNYYRQRHVGCMAYNYWFHQPHVVRPQAWICGHIHESHGSEQYENTTFYNVAMCDRDYKQTNPAVIIEVSK